MYKGHAYAVANRRVRNDVCTVQRSIYVIHVWCVCFRFVTNYLKIFIKLGSNAHMTKLMKT